MLSLFLTATVDALSRALANAPAGPVVVVGSPRVARALAARGHTVIGLAPTPRALRRCRDSAACRADAVPIRTGAAAALVGLCEGEPPDAARLAEWSRVVRAGGTLALVSRAPRTELSRRALCAGLMELEQRVAGRTIITSGTVTTLAAA
jgi:hypothetical protein